MPELETLRALADLGTLPVVVYVGLTLCKHIRSWQPTFRVIVVDPEEQGHE